MPTNGHHQIPSKSLEVLGDRRPSHKSKLLSGAQSDRLGKSVYKTDCTKLCSCENVLDCLVTHVYVGRKNACDTEGLIDQVLCRFELLLCLPVFSRKLISKLAGALLGHGKSLPNRET